MSKDLLFILFWCCCCFCFPFFKKSQLASLPVCLWYWKERYPILGKKNKASILTLYCISILWLYLGYIVYIVISVYQYIYSKVSLLIDIMYCFQFQQNTQPTFGKLVLQKPSMLSTFHLYNFVCLLFHVISGFESLLCTSQILK